MIPHRPAGITSRAVAERFKSVTGVCDIMSCNENHVFDVRSTVAKKVACIMESLPGTRLNKPNEYLPQIDALIAEIADREFLKIVAIAAKLARIDGSDNIDFYDFQGAVGSYIREEGLKTTWKLKPPEREIQSRSQT